MPRSTAENLQVLYEDNHLIAVNKRSGDIVQGDKTGDTPLSDIVKQYLKVKYNKPGNVFAGVIHRIDRPVSGVVVFARTSKALARMNKLLQGKGLQKTYWAVTEERPPLEAGNVVNWLKKNQERNKSHAHDREVNGSKHSELNYKLIGSGDRYHFLEIDPKTGRHHQIRVQLAHMGSIIKGDLKYGAKRSNKDASINLHARKLQFVHPVKNEPVTIVAPPPSDPLWDAFVDMAKA